MSTLNDNVNIKHMPNGISDELSKFSKYGPSGIAVLCLGVLLITIRMLYSLSTDKIDDNTDIIRESISVDQQLISAVEKLEIAIQSKQGQSNLRSLNTELVAVPRNMPDDVVPKLFEVIPASTTTAP